MIACGELGPAVSPQNVRKTTVVSGNREDRGREQLDQVSPLYIDSFFPLLCVRASERGVCLNGFSSLSISWQTANCAGAFKDLPCFGGDCCATFSPSRMYKMAKWGKVSQKHWAGTRQTRCRKGCSEVYLGNSAPPSASFQELVTSSWSQLNVKHKKPVHPWFCDPNLMRKDHRYLGSLSFVWC